MSKRRCPVARIPFLSVFVWLLPLSSFCEGASSLLREFEFRETAAAGEGATALVAAGTETKPVFFVAAGEKIYLADASAGPVKIASLPSHVRMLSRLPGSGAVFALTEEGKGYSVTRDGKVALTADPPKESAYRFVAFTSLSLYFKKPYAVLWKRNRAPEVCRLKRSADGKLSVETKLGSFWKPIVSWDFCEIPGRWGLLAVGAGGEIWRVDSLGRPAPWFISRKLAGATAVVSDLFGLFGGTLLIPIPGKGEIWTVTSDGRSNRIKKIARDFEKMGVRSPLSFGAGGTLYVLAGGKIYAMTPQSGSVFEKSVPAYREALKLFGEGKFKAAADRAKIALKNLRKPRTWIDRIKRLREACEGSLRLKELKAAAKKRGYARFLRTAFALEKKYGGNLWLARDILLFRKKCEAAVSAVFLADFEDESVPPDFKKPVPEAVDSVVRRAAAPEPVREGEFSLKWIVSGKLSSALEFKSPQWGDSDEYSSFSLWIYSRRSRYRLILRVLNSTNVEIATYPVILKKGWQKFMRPPVSMGPEELPTSLILSGLVLETNSRGANGIYIDDVRLLRKGRK